MIMNVEKEYCDALNAMAKPGGASSDKIEAVEKELGVVFPAPYRRFLAQYGAGIGTGFELAGIFEDTNNDEPSMWRSVLLKTKQLRRVWRGALPNYLIPVADDGQSTTFYIDTKSEAARIVAYGPGVDGQLVATSFKEFVVKVSKGEL
jgi:cell wall assembly regulator SMI1